MSNPNNADRHAWLTHQLTQACHQTEMDKGQHFDFNEQQMSFLWEQLQVCGRQQFQYATQYDCWLFDPPHIVQQIVEQHQQVWRPQNPVQYGGYSGQPQQQCQYAHGAPHGMGQPPISSGPPIGSAHGMGQHPICSNLLLARRMEWDSLLLAWCIEWDSLWLLSMSVVFDIRKLILPNLSKFGRKPKPYQILGPDFGIFFTLDTTSVPNIGT